MRNTLRMAPLCLGATLFSTTAHAQAFNCRYARQADEVAMCQSARLQALDERMSSLYYRVRNNAGRSAASFEIERKQFLNQRRRCGSDSRCIAAAYNSFIESLEYHE